MKLGTFVVLIETLSKFSEHISEMFAQIQITASTYTSVVRVSSLLNAQSRRKDLLRGQKRREKLLIDFMDSEGDAFRDDRILVSPGTQVEYIDFTEAAGSRVKPWSLPSKGLIMEQGQIIAVHSPQKNAAGKQTFLKALARVLLPVEGFIHYPENLRVRYIDSQPMLLEASVYRNLKFGNQQVHPDADLRAACKMLNLSENLWNDVDETTGTWGQKYVGANGAKLAMSERIRVTLLRALLSSVDLLLLHNVLDPLDPDDVKQIIDVLKQFVKNRGITCLSIDMKAESHLRKQKTVVIGTKNPLIERYVHNSILISD
jgi:ABC-type multidrug transport system fused ATPase/permease subunit